jgi:DNA repair protein RecO (recombination protein O)
MLKKDEGVVLSHARSGESSKSVNFLGRRSGKIRLLAKGALAAKSAFRGALEAGSHLEVLYYHKEGRRVHYMKEVHVFSGAAGVKDSLEDMACMLAALELLDQVCYWESPEVQVVDVLLEFLRRERGPDPLVALLAFEFKLLAILGALPEFTNCAHCGVDVENGFYMPEEGLSACSKHAKETPHRLRLERSTVDVMHVILAAPISGMAALDIDVAVRKHLGKILHWTYTYHVQGYSLPKALKLIPRDR